MANIEYIEIDPDDVRWRDALAACEHDIYHLPGYVALEAARTGTRAAAGYVCWDTGAMLVPYLVREVPGHPELTDVVSPYGYSGALLVGDSDEETRREAVRCLFDGLGETGACSLFLRMHPLLDAANDAFGPDHLHRTGDTVVVDLTLPEDELWQNLSKDVRRVIRRAREQGLQAEMVRPGPFLDVYASIYRETMERVEASDDYFSFNRDYDRALLDALGGRLHMSLVRLEDEVLSASLNSLSGGVVQSLLGGTRTAALPMRPTVLETYAAMEWFRAAGGRVLNLGGGVGGSHDSLFRFKQSFSKDTRAFYSVRAVLQPDSYSSLVDDRARALGVSVDQLAGTGYFPSYRASA